MTDLETTARRFGYRLHGDGFDVGRARVSASNGDLFASTCDATTADALWHCDIGVVLYRQRQAGYITLMFGPQRLGEIILAAEGAS